MKFRITGISDTHNKHNQLEGKLPGGDILIHSGDITSLGRKDEVKRFIKWFGKQEYTYKVFIACLLYTSPSPRDRQKSRMPSSA